MWKQTRANYKRRGQQVFWGASRAPSGQPADGIPKCLPPVFKNFMLIFINALFKRLVNSVG